MLQFVKVEMLCTFTNPFFVASVIMLSLHKSVKNFLEQRFQATGTCARSKWDQNNFYFDKPVYIYFKCLDYGHKIYQQVVIQNQHQYV